MARPARTPIPGLDTVRAVAVLLVVGYHLSVPGLGGGFLGVTIFFVVSGYLITRLLLEEIETAGSLDLIAFWRRRLRRLVPVAFVAVASCLGWAVLAAPRQLPRVRADSLAAFGYASNWWAIVHRVSYFDSFDLPSPLTHFWSLAIEEQFYLVWPLVLVALVALLGKRAVVATLVALVLGSTTVMVLTFDPAHPNRAYLGTDTRAAELLVGALLAVALHLVSDKLPGRLAARRAALLANGWLPLAGGAAVLALGVLVAGAHAGSDALFRGGFLLVATMTAVVILGLQADALGRPVAALERGPAGWLGRRSYSIYVWHFPILIACSDAASYSDFSPERAGFVLAATLLAAEGSYRWIETPVRTHGFRTVARSALHGVRRLRPPAQLATAVLGSLALLVVAGAMAGLRQPAPEAHGPTRVVVGAKPEPVEQHGHGIVRGPGPHRKTTSAPRPPDVESPTAEPSRPRAVQTPAPMTGSATVAVGDSLMIDIAPRLRRRLPGVTINAQVGRQPWTGLTVARSYAQFNRAGATYILGIGTNGAINAHDLIGFCRAHALARVLLITPKVHRVWESASVAAIRIAATACPNVRVVDFHSAGERHPEYFGPDGVHLTKVGTEAMIGLITAAGKR